MNREKGFSLLPLLSVVVLLCWSALSFAQDGKEINEVINEADELLKMESKACINKGKKICEELLRGKKVTPRSIEEGYLYERIAYADERIGRGLNLVYYKKALSIYKGLSDEKSKLRQAMILCELSEYDKKHKRAINYLRTALATINKAPNHQKTKGNILSYLGDRYYYLGRPRTALKYYKNALAIYEKIEDFCGQSTTTADIGWCNFQIDPNEKIMPVYYFKRGLELSHKSKAKEAKSQILADLAEFYSCTKNLDKAEKYCKEAIADSKSINSRLSERYLYQRFAEMYKGINDEKAASYKKLYEELDKELGIDSKECNVNNK